jgi:pantothenate kinase type III
MNLTIDIGNTFIKAAIFENKDLITFQERLDYQAITKICESYSIDKVMICDVTHKSNELVN